MPRGRVPNETLRDPRITQPPNRAAFSCPSNDHGAGEVPNAHLYALSLKDIIDAVSTLGTLGFALLAVYAFLTERIVPRSRLDEQRADKKEALDIARTAIASNERLADAVEARNQLEAAREQAEADVARRRRP